MSPWDQEGATPLEDIRRMKADMKKLSGLRPYKLIINQPVMLLLMVHGLEPGRGWISRLKRRVIHWAVKKFVGRYGMPRDIEGYATVPDFPIEDDET